MVLGSGNKTSRCQLKPQYECLLLVYCVVTINVKQYKVCCWYCKRSLYSTQKTKTNRSLVWLVLEARGISLDSLSPWNRGGIHSKFHQSRQLNCCSIFRNLVKMLCLNKRCFVENRSWLAILGPLG